jgi:hypothetical protein
MNSCFYHLFEVDVLLIGVHSVDGLGVIIELCCVTIYTCVVIDYDAK